MEFGIDTIIVAIIGATATIYGIREARAGRRDAAVQQIAANKLNDEKQELEALRFVIDNERTEADRAHKARDDARAEAEDERHRRIEAEAALRVTQEQARADSLRSAQDYSELLSIVRGAVALEAERTEQALTDAEDKT